MKYIIVTAFKLLVWIFVMILCVLRQILHTIWHLKPEKHVLSNIITGDYYCYSARKANSAFSSSICKVNVTTNSPLKYLKWLFKYGLCGEMKDLTKKEREAYLEFYKKQ